MKALFLRLGLCGSHWDVIDCNVRIISNAVSDLQLLFLQFSHRNMQTTCGLSAQYMPAFAQQNKSETSVKSTMQATNLRCY